MTGTSQKITTTGTGRDVSLAFILGGTPDPVPCFAISIRADPNNSAGKAIYAGRLSAVEPFYADDSRTYYSAREEEIIINDGGTSNLVLYVDYSGPMDPLAQYATVVTAAPIRVIGVKSPNDPTP
jgi:hypothetical protein